ncbi:HIRAN domain-containing protein [Ruegeria atlantica]|uniref:HIRAN domain-containing protein n=1 Tax=Ruegeria atlantica TaxID=81569 RepID=UPI00249423F9|nr:HIRAN domain-containing protein [Ruegeria atlantica]
MTQFISVAQFNETPDSARWMETDLAGLQFYDYDTTDELIGDVRPAFGDRVQLVRQPKNRFDTNAIQVWWRDGRFQLGHLPRRLAADLAPLMDAGMHIRGYISEEGDENPWSVEVTLVHEDLPEHLWKQQLFHEARLLDLAAARFYRNLDDDEHFLQKQQERYDFRRSLKKVRENRRLDAATALAELLVEDADLDHPALPPAPSRTLRGKTIAWWDEIPEGVGLMTKTQWSEAGFKLKPRLKGPFAWIEYRSGRRHRRYDLYSSDQVVPKKQKSRAQIVNQLAHKIA